MKFHLLICTILPLILAEELNYHRRRFTSNDDHLNSIGKYGQKEVPVHKMLIDEVQIIKE